MSIKWAPRCEGDSLAIAQLFFIFFGSGHAVPPTHHRTRAQGSKPFPTEAAARRFEHCTSSFRVRASTTE